MYNKKIEKYSVSPINKIENKNATIVYWEENSLCWDDLKVFLTIEDNILVDWSFTWDIGIISTACASIFWENVIWRNLDDILLLWYNYITDLIEDTVSDRRKKSSLLWILTTRNAIHKFLDDWKKDSFEDLINN